VTTFRLQLQVPAARAREVADRLERCDAPAPTAIGYFEANEGRWVVEAYYGEPPDGAGLARLLGANDAAMISIEEIGEHDWIARSEQARPPVRVGAFLIHGSHDRRLARGHRLAIEIDAGLAFGTAHHGTTTGCLTAMGELFRSGMLDRRARVLDVGTGTGILAIAVAKILAGAPVLAIDNDALAVGVARENARLNGVGDRVRIVLGDGVTGGIARRSGPFDLVLANILAGPLKAMAGDIARVTAPAGRIVLSGLLAHQRHAVDAHYRTAGFSRERTIGRDGWVTLVLRRRICSAAIPRRPGSGGIAP